MNNRRYYLGLAPLWELSKPPEVADSKPLIGCNKTNRLVARFLAAESYIEPGEKAKLARQADAQRKDYDYDDDEEEKYDVLLACLCNLRRADGCSSPADLTQLAAQIVGPRFPGCSVVLFALRILREVISSLRMLLMDRPADRPGSSSIQRTKTAARSLI